MSHHRTQPPTILLDTLFSSDAPLEHLSLYSTTDDVQAPSPTVDDESRPWVTLTFAQSLDAKIAGEAGKQLILSGKESMLMTHWMRSMHDAILVGIGTALNDNPQLNTRLLPQLPADNPHRYHLPRPVVVDTHLRLRLDCKLLNNYRAGVGRRPWVMSSAPIGEAEGKTWREQRKALEDAGARVVEVGADSGGISIPSMLAVLRSLGVRSLMVEGGAGIIKSFLAAATADNVGETVDALIVTVAPTFVGREGVGYGENLLAAEVPRLRHKHTEIVGQDTVVAFRL
ncbi:2,5-diamino-6-(ribosylamino)-4(3H)-pyrimidinone 5'-phosphate reductase [Steccherinum ochraceum]|uniref:2,5-diamino-6-ribosylamino-4(3H)-pyrimidinone 5'-phosphate reductase n=1 Tax=Steccherinum ochraceum TaxID=92696 RepID=A0A4R0RHL6_9APHY|nr:2,5-diamino-6-(ribosylamino)-4(3H)-pyrimidinone 5'-phosphate reductase [Steccherinum ochraceum]